MKKYEETATWIHRIEIQYALNGTVVTVLYNNGYEAKFVYHHDSMFDGVKHQEHDIADAISRTLKREKARE